MGIIVGQVTNRQGTPLKGETVAASFGSIIGGVSFTKTDAQGNFKFEYSGVGRAEYVSVQGGDRVDHVASGSRLHLFK